MSDVDWSEVWRIAEPWMRGVGWLGLAWCANRVIMSFRLKRFGKILRSRITQMKIWDDPHRESEFLSGIREYQRRRDFDVLKAYERFMSTYTRRTVDLTVEGVRTFLRRRVAKRITVPQIEAVELVRTAVIPANVDYIRWEQWQDITRYIVRHPDTAGSVLKIIERGVFDIREIELMARQMDGTTSTVLSEGVL